MIVPQYWAEGRLQHKQKGRQVTVRRLGWSDVSQADAQANADTRTAEALQRILSGEPVDRREPKAAYNGALGVPIREEIVARHGSTIITRNSYGARCLNTPDVLFADVDFVLEPGCGLGLATLLILIATSVAIGMWQHSKLIGIVLGILSCLACYPITWSIFRVVQSLSGGEERTALRRIYSFLSRNANWTLRIYRTPAGLRLLALHRTFDPRDPEVAEFFSFLKVDPLYARMCFNQHCFRARLTAKPWRIGIADHMKPRPGIWPVKPERLPDRMAWVEKYEAAAQSYAACWLIDTVGNGRIHPDVAPVQELHDSLSKANSTLPIA